MNHFGEKKTQQEEVNGSKIIPLLLNKNQEKSQEKATCVTTFEGEFTNYY